MLFSLAIWEEEEMFSEEAGDLLTTEKSSRGSCRRHGKEKSSGKLSQLREEVKSI